MINLNNSFEGNLLQTYCMGLILQLFENCDSRFSLGVYEFCIICPAMSHKIKVTITQKAIYGAE